VPNWCHNKLTVTGPPEAVDAFVGKVAGIDADTGDLTVLTFTAHVPEPALEESSEWRSEHWGTAADAEPHAPGWRVGTAGAVAHRPSSASWMPVEGGTQIVFRTTWSPPVPWLAAVAVAEPELTFELLYAEVGHGYAGRATAHGSEFTDDDSLDVGDVLTPDELWF
jgi:hypothetical protein